MKEHLVNFETAAFALQKGFDIHTPKSYYNDNDKIVVYDTGSFRLCYAPTQSLLKDWCRIKHNIHINIIYLPEDDLYDCQVVESNYRGVFRDDYYLGLEDCLMEALK